MKTVSTISILIGMMLTANIMWGIYGDVNFDGKVTPVDLSLIMQYVTEEMTLNVDQQVRGDVTGDGVLSSMDAALIFQKITGLISQFPVEPPEGMVLIPAGEFSMGDHHDVGDSDEKPVHTIYLDAYYIDKYEVTNAQYATFLNEYGKNVDAAGHELLRIDSEWCLIEKVGNTYQPKAGYEYHPVIKVSWYGAAAYAQFYGRRLPTEAQWEKAARGGLVGKMYPNGNTITHDDANYSGTGGHDIWDETSPVGSFPPNDYGLYDMAGNVWEWCADEYDPDYYSVSPKDNPLGPGTPVFFVNDDFTQLTNCRVLRGGGWMDGDGLRCASRDGYSDPTPTYDLGFRCAQDK